MISRNQIAIPCTVLISILVGGCARNNPVSEVEMPFWQATSIISHTDGSHVDVLDIQQKNGIIYVAALFQNSDSLRIYTSADAGQSWNASRTIGQYLGASIVT